LIDNDGGMSRKRFETQNYQHDMNLIRTTYFQLRTATVFAYTVCCTSGRFDLLTLIK